MIATEKKDLYTAGHNLRVTLYALKPAKEMGFRPDQQRAIIELHRVRGYEMCRELGFMKDELEIIRGHHERWDGRGYPDRLEGERIPLLARIVAVADVYDALTSHRAYRQAMSHEAAMAVLTEQRGSDRKRRRRCRVYRRREKVHRNVKARPGRSGRVFVTRGRRGSGAPSP